ncbi:hypothetical protein EDD92_9712 [Streptomyces sp. TLI_185]|nr:hypothetical protein EDD92_9712 [Streptomyces sp. TLI_185]
MNDTSPAFQHLVLAIAILSSTVAAAVAFVPPRWEGGTMPAGLTLWVQELVLRGDPRRGVNGSTAGPWQPSMQRANWMLPAGALSPQRTHFRMLHHLAARARQLWTAQRAQIKTACTQLRGAA